MDSRLRRRRSNEGVTTNEVAEGSPPRDVRTASALEADYARFGRAGRPITTVAIALAGFIALFFVNGPVRVPTANTSAVQIIVYWIKNHGVEVCFSLPAFVAAFRARRIVKSILLGKLAVLPMLGIGVSVGCCCVAFSTIVSQAYFFWPEFHLGRLWNPGAPWVTAYVIGPIGEEMFYQGGLQTWLQRFGPIVAVVGATTPFWGFHLYGGFVPMPEAILFLLPSLLAFALLRQTTKSLGAAIIAHSTYNVLVTIFYFAPR